MRTILKLFALMFLVPFKFIKILVQMFKDAIDRWYNDMLDKESDEIV